MKTRISQKEKLRENNKTSWDVVQERDSRRARLLTFGGNTTRVEITWDLNQDAIRDRMFKIQVGDKYAIINAEEMRRFIRWV